VRVSEGKKPIYPVQFKWVCYYCIKHFFQLIQLSRHLSRRHTIENPFRCNLCYAEFYVSEDVRVHIASQQTRELSYSCHYCFFRARASWQLNQHNKKLYHEQILHTCNICKLTCNSIAHLWEHMKLHREKNLFVCYFRAKACKVQYRLFQRMQSTHLREAVIMCNTQQGTCETIRNIV